jgi:uncharacterized ferredoxin-like protein
MKIDGVELEATGLLEAARLIAIAARTAPKARGMDRIVTAVFAGDDKDLLADEMQRIGEQSGAGFFVRDAGNLRSAGAVVLLGAKNQRLNLPNCGFCGFADCAGNEAKQGICAFTHVDLGIAVGSAVSVAADHRVDCRVFFTAGRAALNLASLGEDVQVALGIPLSVSGKSPFFDRK